MNKFVTIGDEKVNITEIENAKTVPELLQSRVQYAILDQLTHLLSQSENPENSLKKIKDSLILDITKIIDNYTPPQKNNDDD